MKRKIGFSLAVMRCGEAFVSAKQPYNGVSNVHAVLRYVILVAMFN